MLSGFVYVKADSTGKSGYLGHYEHPETSKFDCNEVFKWQNDFSNHSAIWLRLGYAKPDDFYADRVRWK
jgi:hypothetical protein